MKTAEELLAYCNKKQEECGLSFHLDSVLFYMPFELAKSSLKDDVTSDRWAEEYKPLTREAIIAEMNDYFDFAMEKAKGQRGISAARSIQKYQTWLFALGDEELSEEIENYSNYGLPQLKKIKEKYLSEVK